MELHFSWFVYGGPIAAIVVIYWLRGAVRDRQSRQTLAENIAAGLTEPASLHPEIDPVTCLGCGTCVGACPEGDVLGIISGKAKLIHPTSCIGHGACKEACPTGAISLVFGTATRGVDIPQVNPDFSTNIPGIFIAGELGGMGLIRNAITQGRQAVDAIAAHVASPGQDMADEMLDLVIIGAGPAGFSASLAAKEQGLSFVTLEQETFGGTVAHYPRGKIVMTAPVDLPIIGKARFKEVSKEELMAFWEDVRERTGLEVHYSERVTGIKPIDGGYDVKTETGSYRARAVLLAIGRRGTPRKLGVPGEDLSKVVYRLVDPEQYRGQHVLVVGGGDSALEAAWSLADEEGTTVTLAYRGEAFGRAKAKNRDRVAERAEDGRLTVMFQTEPQEIHENEVWLKQGDDVTAIRNDGVIVCAGGILPSAFLKDIGIHVETKYGTA